MLNSVAASSLLAFAITQACGHAQGIDPDANPPMQRVTVDARALPFSFSEEAPLGPTYDRGTASQFVFTGDLPEGDAPSDIVFTDDGSKIIISHRESRNLIIWDAATRAFLGEVPISGAAQGVDVTSDGSNAVVANVDNNTISIVDLNSLTETSVIPTGLNPGVVRISPADDLAVVSLTGDSKLAVVDIATGTIVRTIANIGYSATYSFSPEPPASSLQFSDFRFIDDDRVINVDGFNNQAQIANVRTGAVTRLTIPANGRDVSVSIDGSTAAISHASSTRRVTVIDTASESIIATWSTPEDLWGEITLNEDGSMAVVAVLNACRVADLTSGTFGSQLSTASVNELLTTRDGRTAVCVGYYGALISFTSGTVVANTNFQVSTEFGAVSPIDSRAAMCSTTFGDDLVVIGTNGAGGSLQAFQLTGPLPEGDRCRTIAVSPDGSRAAGVSIFSDSLAVIDTASNSVTGIAPLGQRPSAVAITPDGSRAVVGNLDSTFATIVDLATATSTNVNISTRAGAVAISPDNHYAYVGVVAGTDGVWRIDLTTNTVAGALIPTGNMGGVGYSYSQTSDMKLSNDGSILAVAGSFTNNVSLINTASWSLIANVPVGNFPTMLAFSPDDSKLYVANRNGDDVSVISLAGVPGVTSTIVVGDSPWQMIDDGNGRLWVNNWGNKQVALYDVATGTRIIALAIPDYPVGMHLDASAHKLYVANGTSTTTFGGAIGYAHAEDGRLSVIDTSTLTFDSPIPLGYAPSALAADAASTVLAVAAPEADGAVVVNLDGPCNDADFATPFGTLDFFDVQTFLGLFSAHSPSADLNDDSAFDFFDVQLFLNLFSGGCP